MSEWRTIESAPLNKDILLSGDRPIFIGRICEAYNGKFYYELSASDCQTGCGDTGNPTHWMLLPGQPPITQDTRE